MNYDGATGWLIGEDNSGLNAMFTMMNEARLGVGMQGLARRRRSPIRTPSTYAKERLQGRSISGVKSPDKPADPIIVHPDIRRTLMSMKAFNEAARALVLWTALQGDIAHRSDDEKARQAADDHMGLMTPVIKGVLTDKGFANTVAAQQVFGGHGYIAEHGMEQFVRDARIAMIYEGANGIQALDLVGRKLGRDGGRAVTAFFKEVAAFVQGAPRRRGDEAFRRRRSARRWRICSRRRCGSCRTRWRSPTMPAPARPTTCISSASSRSATCGRRWRRPRRTSSRPARTAREERMKAKLVTGKILHGAHAAGDRRAPQAHPVGRGHA